MNRTAKLDFSAPLFQIDDTWFLAQHIMAVRRETNGQEEPTENHDKSAYGEYNYVEWVLGFSVLVGGEWLKWRIEYDDDDPAENNKNEHFCIGVIAQLLDAIGGIKG